MEGYCSTGQSPQRAVVPMEEEEEKEITCIFKQEFQKYDPIKQSNQKRNVFLSASSWPNPRFWRYSRTL
jgi:hypothetical protein